MVFSGNLKRKARIYILLGLAMIEWNQGGTKLFAFRDRQNSCLQSTARLDSPGDQERGNSITTWT